MYYPAALSDAGQEPLADAGQEAQGAAAEDAGAAEGAAAGGGASFFPSGFGDAALLFLSFT